jgi:hypothetical protein
VLLGEYPAEVVGFRRIHTVFLTIKSLLKII